MASYKSYGQYDYDVHERRRKEIEKELLDIRSELSNNERKELQGTMKHETVVRKKFDLEGKAIQLSLESSAEYYHTRIASINMRGGITAGIERRKAIDHAVSYGEAVESMRTINNSPLVTGDIDYSTMITDARAVFVLEGFVNRIKANKAFENDQEMKMILGIASEVVSSYHGVIRDKERELEGQVEDAFKTIASVTKDSSRDTHDKAESYSRDVDKKMRENGFHSLENITKTSSLSRTGAEEAEPIMERSPVKSDIDFAMQHGLSDLIGKLAPGEGLARREEIIETLQKMVQLVGDTLPQEQSYGSVYYDFNPVIEKAKSASVKLETKMEIVHQDMDKIGFTEARSKVEASRVRFGQVMALSRLYEKLTPTVAGSVRKEIENDIDTYLSGLGLSGPELDVIKMEAQNVADAKRSAEMAEAASKADAARVREDRFIAQANLTGVSQSEYDSIVRDVTLYASSHFTDEAERDRYIQAEVARRAEHKAGLIFDEGQREIARQDHAFSSNVEKQQKYQFTDEQLGFAAQRIWLDGVIPSTDMGDLTEEQRGMVIDYAIKLSSLAGKSADEIAAAMVTDPYVVNGRTVTREATPMNIRAQKEVNERNGLDGELLESIYGPSKAVSDEPAHKK